MHPIFSLLKVLFNTRFLIRNAASQDKYSRIFLDFWTKWPIFKKILKTLKISIFHSISQSEESTLFFVLIETRKYHRGASVPKQIWPLPGTKYHCQRTKKVQWKNVNHIPGGVVQVHCRNSYNAKYARRTTSNQLCVA